MFDYEYYPKRIAATCVICGLPLSQNPHPMAGKPGHLNNVGAVLDCLPCAERRANGRRLVITDMKRWLQSELKEGTCPEYLAAIRKVQEKLTELDEARRVEFHSQK